MIVGRTLRFYYFQKTNTPRKLMRLFIVVCAIRSAFHETFSIVCFLVYMNLCFFA